MGEAQVASTSGSLEVSDGPGGGSTDRAHQQQPGSMAAAPSPSLESSDPTIGDSTFDPDGAVAGEGSRVGEPSTEPSTASRSAIRQAIKFGGAQPGSWRAGPRGDVPAVRAKTAPSARERPAGGTRASRLQSAVAGSLRTSHYDQDDSELHREMRRAIDAIGKHRRHKGPPYATSLI